MADIGKGGDGYGMDVEKIMINIITHIMTSALYTYEQ